ncbi:MAG: hypothetical protein A6F72_09185, partial [Cycloclasticus sp. symbiont of Poecilosclerida sp. N]
DLSLSDGTLDPAFDSTMTDYTATVDNTVSSITLTPTVNNPAATVTVNGDPVTDDPVTGGKVSDSIALAEGANTINIKVTSADTTNSQTYTVIVTRAAPDPSQFITIWRVLAGDTLTFPGEGNYTINWGDNTPTKRVSSATDHTYTNKGDYQIVVSRGITRFNLDGGEDKEKLIDIRQWGSAEWRSMEGAFRGASAMTMSADDIPVLTEVGSMQSMFHDATDFNGDISGWTVDSVTDMSFMFLNGLAFNQNIGNWNVVNVRNMDGMFANTPFNGDISSWNVTNVSNMSGMFSSATAFNQNIGGWNVAGVMDMSSMFFGASAFTKYIGDWNVAEVTTMENMFNLASAFNQDISGWKVGKVTTMEGMFSGARAFNQNIGSWKVGTVTTMSNMFFGAIVFDGNIGSWNVKSVTNMNNMFTFADAFNQDISGWNVRRATNMFNMFNSAATFSQNLGPWYIVPTTTANTPGGEVRTLATQNTFLSRQNPDYSLVIGTGDGNNNDFSISSTALSTVLSAKPNLPFGTYSVRVGASGSLFGTDNARILSIDIDNPSDASLSDLSLSDGTLDPAFDSTMTDYTATVDNTVSSITLTPTVNNPAATVTVDGDPVTSGKASEDITLAAGATTDIVVVVTAPKGSPQSYTVTVNRAAGSDASLRDLSLSDGTLDPGFESTITGYTASVGNEISELRVTPTVADANATVMVGDETVVSGTASQAITLPPGVATAIVVKVTAQDGSPQSYTVTVNRAAGSDA